MTPENQGFPAQKAREGPQEHPGTLETQDFRVYPARMVPRDPLESQDAMVQRVTEDQLGPLACLGSRETRDHQDSQG